MIESLQRLGLFTLYQTTVLLGIVLMPLALLARRLGVHLPVGELVETLGRAYDETK
ncbi:MAG: hypothetical protein ABEJ82_00875 [Haloplanus sp.]